MARTRKIRTDDILDAAERVVLREGAAGLSIDAVAQEAGVSKSRVVYDHKSKSGLLEALIERHICAEEERIEQAVQSHADTPHPQLFGRVSVAEEVPDDVDRAVCLAIAAAVSSDENVRQRMREWTERDIKDMKAGARPRAALVAYLALTGFYCTEFFNFYHWEQGERHAVLDGIRDIYTSLSDEK